MTLPGGGRVGPTWYSQAERILMDGDFRHTGLRQRDPRHVTDVATEQGIVARAYRSIRSLLPARTGAIDPETASDARPTARWRYSAALLSFIAFVIVPSLIADIYVVFIASDQYLAETRAVVRSAEQESAVQSAMANSGATSPAAASGLSLSTVTPNAYIVTNYIRSRAMVDALSKTINLREVFRRPEADFWARLSGDASIEDLVEYWQHMVVTYVDGPSGIVTIRIRAFRRDDAMLLSQAVIKLSEQLVNEISERARRDAMEFAEREVRRADGLVRTALIDLRRYRDEESIIDPAEAAKDTSKLVMQLMTDKIKLESDLFVASKVMNASAPTIQNLKARIEIVDTQIAVLRAKLTGDSTDVRNLAAKLARFEGLEVQRQFSERLYSMAQDGLERARMTAERQSVYFTVFVQPSLPEDSEFPRRLAFSLLIPAGLFVLWSIVALICASVEDHRV